MGRRDLMDRSVFNFESSDADGDDDCVDRFSFFEALRRQRSQLKQVELNSGRNAIQPLKNLALINKKVICVGVGDESAGTDYDLAKCYDKLLPNITKQLEESPDTYPAQEIAWPHLLEGGSAIIIDPSDNLADLVYLPVVCTHVEVRKSILVSNAFHSIKMNFAETEDEPRMQGAAGNHHMQNAKSLRRYCQTMHQLLNGRLHGELLRMHNI